MASLLAFFTRLFGADSSAKPPYEQAEVHKGLRSRILELKPSDIGESDADKILAVVMETGYEKTAVTLVAVCDGAASIYFSNGGGILGAGGQPQGRAAALSLISEAAKFRSSLILSKDAPLPQPGQTLFYLVTGKGLLTASAKEVDLGEQRHKLSPLFYKAQELITAIRLTNEAREKADSTERQPKKP